MTGIAEPLLKSPSTSESRDILSRSARESPPSPTEAPSSWHSLCKLRIKNRHQGLQEDSIRNTTLIPLLIFVLGLSLFSGRIDASSKAPPAVQKNSEKTDAPYWAGKMRKTAEALQKMLPFIYNETKFSELRNRKHVESLILNYHKSSHFISEKKARQILGDDPHVVILLGDLKGYTKYALQYYREGQFKNSRQVLKTSTETCFQCHTRMNSGPKNYFWKDFEIEKYDLAPFEKIQLLIGMRQFKAATEAIRKAVNDQSLKKSHDYAYEKLVRMYLFVAIRGMDSLTDAYQFLTSQGDNPSASGTFISTMASWKRDLTYWIAQESEKKKSPPDLKELLDLKGYRVNATKDDDFVKQLIATKSLHQQIKDKKTKASMATAYLYLGQIYDRMIDGVSWELPEVYYEACVKTVPHSKLAESCFKYYKENVVFGYTGSRGTDIPSHAMKRMSDLEKVATAKVKPAKKGKL